jgi:hypothetical protein
MHRILAIAILRAQIPEIAGFLTIAARRSQ